MIRIIMMVLLALPVLTRANEPRRIYFDRLTTLCDTVIPLPACPSATEIGLEVRYTTGRSKPSAGLASNYASLIWSDADTTASWRATLRPGLSSTDEAVSTEFVNLSVWRGDSLVLSRDFDNISAAGGLSFCADITTRSATFAAGSALLSGLTAIEGQFAPSGRVAIGSAGCIDIVLAVEEIKEDMAASLLTPYSPEQLAAMTENSEPPQGIWQFLDRDTDSRRALAGGRYTLAVVRQPGGDAYDIIYISGAEVNSSAWIPGMKKGELRPTIFSNHYDLIWYDSQMRPIERDANASTEQGAILTLSFPALKSTLRFSRAFVNLP